MKAVVKCVQWLTTRERRQSRRKTRIPLVVHYWDGGAPMAHEVRDVSPDGLYALTEHRWYPGTLVMLSLQRTDLSEGDPGRLITVKAKVVRSDEDGVGFSLVNKNDSTGPSIYDVLQGGADHTSFKRFLSHLPAAHGQALIEYILLLPLIFLLIVNVVNFGGFFFAWITVANAARAGADYAILGGASVGGLPPATATAATAAKITDVIKADIASLPNNPSLVVNICKNVLGTVKTLVGTCSSVPSDPEPSNYVLATVDVTYTYVPFIPAGFKFPNLNIYATIPPTTIHRRAVMRLIQ